MFSVSEYELEVDGVMKNAVSLWIKGKESEGRCFIVDDGKIVEFNPKKV